MVLLTSGTVSAAISSGVVFLFTSVLFLSGYVLQQKTVNSLREQIKEPVRPTHTYIYLPPQFADPTPTPEAQQSPDQVETTLTNPEIPDYQQVLEAPAIGGNVGSDNVVAEQAAEAVSGGRVIAVEVGSQIPLGGDTIRQSEVIQEDPARSLDGLSRAERRRRIKEDIAEATKKDREGYHRRTY